MVYKMAKQAALVLQRHCLLCHCAIEQANTVFGLCQACYASLPSAQPCCAKCADVTARAMLLCGECIKKPPSFDQARVCCRYNQDVQSLIVQLKKQHDLAVCRLLVDLLCQQWRLMDWQVDVIIAVPMHWQSQLWRGNNHSALLAKALAKRCGVRFMQNAIKKSRKTRPQHLLTAKMRSRNLFQSFQVSKNVQGLSIAVIDDVMTTGSTANEVAKTLKQAGAEKVYCLAVAKA